ncbi:hypothetical protein JTE90_003592 [Oedothorax gibbosus]|uniref:Uncharacterized protein n=1 Tax=Oedothorax gibbosus TaxID=931172 RepID=A0AAV6TNB2_9ARAC|nr:hypothetical protein JTE90_003592 [Oedothorax gibbosus]
MDGEDHTTDSLLNIEKNSWEETTAKAIKSIEERCLRKEYEGSTTKFGAQSEFARPWSTQKVPRKSQLKTPDGKGKKDREDAKVSFEARKPSYSSEDKKSLRTLDDSQGSASGTPLEVHIEDIKYIDDSAKSSLSTSLQEPSLPSVAPPASFAPSSQSPQLQHLERSCASVLEERYCQAFISSKNEHIADSWNRHYTSPRLPPNHHLYTPKIQA